MLLSLGVQRRWVRNTGKTMFSSYVTVLREANSFSSVHTADLAASRVSKISFRTVPALFLWNVFS